MERNTVHGSAREARQSLLPDYSWVDVSGRHVYRQHQHGHSGAGRMPYGLSGLQRSPLLGVSFLARDHVVAVFLPQKNRQAQQTCNTWTPLLSKAHVGNRYSYMATLQLLQARCSTAQGLESPFVLPSPVQTSNAQGTHEWRPLDGGPYRPHHSSISFRIKFGFTSFVRFANKHT